MLKITISIAISFTMGVAANAQTPTEAYEFVENLINQPNDSTLNWYGSGDVNNDNIVNQADVSRIEQIINESFTDPSDLRLNARSDVNGDEIVTSLDKILLQDYLTGIKGYLPGQWNKLKTRAEQEDWFQKMVNIAKLNETCLNPPQYCDCTEFANQGLIDFRGFNQKDLAEFIKRFPHKTVNNGLYNLPLLKWLITDYDSNGAVIGGHEMNTIVLGKKLTNWYSLCNFEPQTGHINVQPGQDYILGQNAEFDLRGLPIFEEEGDIQNVPLMFYSYYLIKNQIPSESTSLEYLHPNVKLITNEDSLNPNINIVSPVNGMIYASSPNLISNVEDETTFDRYKLAEDGVTKLYCNNNIYYLLNSDEAKNEMFKNTDRALDLGEGDHTIIVKAKDEFDNETTKAVSFSIDETNPDLTTTSPKQDSTYKKNDVKLDYNMSDLHLDLGNSYFTLNGQQQFFTNPSGIRLLNSREGANRLEIISKDKAGNETRKEIDYNYSPQTGLEERLEYSEYGDFPNPTTIFTNIYYPKNKTVFIYFLDLVGKKIKIIQDNDKNGETKVDVSNWPFGFYIYTLIDDSGNTITSKILKE